MAEVTNVTAKKRVLIQLGIPFFVLVGFVVGSIIFGTLYFAGQQRGSDEALDPKSITIALQTSIEGFFKTIGEGVSSAAILLVDGVPTDEEETYLRSLLRENSAILAISYFDENGNQFYELHKSRAEDALLELTFKGDTNTALSKQSQNGYIIVHKTDTGGTYFIWAYPRYNEDNTFIGALAFGIDGNLIKSTLTGYSTIRPSRVQIVDSVTSAPLISASTLSDNVLSFSPTENHFRAIFENNNKDYGYITEDGIRIEGHWENIPGTPWNVIAETPGSGLSDGAGSLFAVSAIILFIFVILVFYYLHMVNRNLILPLKKIQKAIHYFKTGDYSEPVKIETKNEFLSVAEQLNSMSKHIESNTSERVSQLEKVLDRQSTDTKLLIEKDVELRDKGQKLKELDQAKSMFVSVAAHQMRTPLAAIKWAIKLVMDGDVGPVNAEQKEYLGKGYASTTRMINLINDLLDIDKIESDKFSYVFTECSLEDMVQSIVDELTPLSIEKGVKLLFQKDQSEYPTISADKVKLRNSLQNLIDNAIKYTIGGGDVTVKLALNKNVLQLSISDTGIGIPVAEQSKVFGKFFRAKNAVRQETDGSGLGLFIVKKIIDKHGGETRFESKEGVGTTFFVTLPSKDGGGVPITGESSNSNKTRESTISKNAKNSTETTKEVLTPELSSINTNLDKQEVKKEK